MKFCSNCGRQLADAAMFCDVCGNTVGNTMGYNTHVNVNVNNNLVDQLSVRYKVNGIIWIVVAAIQMLTGIAFNWILLAIGVLNLLSAIQDLNYSGSMRTNPVGIVDKVRPIVNPIIVLVYNVIFGGVVGVAGSIYYLVGIRSFVLSNETGFKAIEERY